MSGLTTDPDDPRLARNPAGGMNEVYLVLSEEERAKGFVRPLRRSYVHVGRALCGRPNDDLYQRRRRGGDLPAGVAAYGCSMLPGHEGDCTSWMPLTQAQLDELEKKGTVGGCGVQTVMGLALCETYARDPKFYGATYCVGCRTHLPVGAHGEFVWDEDGERVGT